MSYTFGKEIVKFTLEVLKPGDQTCCTWDKTATFVDPTTMMVLGDDESSDGFLEYVSQPDSIEPDPFVNGYIKVLKPVWYIGLHYLPRGGLDYEISEGWWRDMDEWAVEAAEIFKGQRSLKEKKILSSDIITRIESTLPDEDEFYGLLHSWWDGHDEDADFHLRFLGEIDLAKVEAT